MRRRGGCNGRLAVLLVDIGRAIEPILKEMARERGGMGEEEDPLGKLS
jgi:hypothetical protein